MQMNGAAGMNDLWSRLGFRFGLDIIGPRR